MIEKIVTKVVVNVFDVEGDVTYSVDRLRTRFETNFSKIRAWSITTASAYFAYFAAVRHICRTVERNGRETKPHRYCALVCRNCSFCTVTRLQALRPKYICSIPDTDKYVSVLWNGRTGSGAHGPSQSMLIASSVPGAKDAEAWICPFTYLLHGAGSFLRS